MNRGMRSRGEVAVDYSCRRRASSEIHFPHLCARGRGDPPSPLRRQRSSSAWSVASYTAAGQTAERACDAGVREERGGEEDKAMLHEAVRMVCYRGLVLRD